jgi:hypothetical protein
VVRSSGQRCRLREAAPIHDWRGAREGRGATVVDKGSNGRGGCKEEALRRTMARRCRRDLVRCADEGAELARLVDGFALSHVQLLLGKGGDSSRATGD